MTNRTSPNEPSWSPGNHDRTRASSGNPVPVTTTVTSDSEISGSGLPTMPRRPASTTMSTPVSTSSPRRASRSASHTPRRDAACWCARSPGNRLAFESASGKSRDGNSSANW